LGAGAPCFWTAGFPGSWQSGMTGKKYIACQAFDLCLSAFSPFPIAFLDSRMRFVLVLSDFLSEAVLI
jgi:hypothetical protein